MLLRLSENEEMCGCGLCKDEECVGVVYAREQEI